MLNVLLLTAGQILWKIAINQAGGFTMANAVKVLLSPLIIAGLILFVIATGLWFAVLGKADLSYAYPLQSTAYILGMLAAWLIFKEVIPVTRWIGMGVIVIGIYLVSMK
jgi:drug/metabolite transporter (DMT)-like permease